MKPYQLREFEKILNEAKDLAKRKSSDYSDDVPVDNIGILGLDGVFCRITDKWARLYSLMWLKKAPQVLSEKLEDTLLDLLVYCVIALIVLRKKWSEKNKFQSMSIEKGYSTTGHQFIPAQMSPCKECRRFYYHTDECKNG